MALVAGFACWLLNALRLSVVPLVKRRYDTKDGSTLLRIPPAKDVMTKNSRLGFHTRRVLDMPVEMHKRSLYQCEFRSHHIGPLIEMRVGPNRYHDVPPGSSLTFCHACGSRLLPTFCSLPRESLGVEGPHRGHK